ncbi:MAG: trypsin-like peptidase domain-containing protein [Flavobacteriales bacterium]
MKSLLSGLGLALALLCSAPLFAQDSPPGYTMLSADLDALETLDAPTFVFEELMADAEARDKRGGLSVYGKIGELPVSADDHGQWTVMANGDRIWQLRFRSAGAKAVNVFFNRLFIPEGASLFLYSADRSWFEGPYTSEENSAHGIFQTAEVFGDEAILEYYEPASVISRPSLHIRGFGHFFRFIHDYRDELRGGSGSCQVDVNCPEGSNFVPERQAVVRLSIPAGQDVGLCTGTLVNNTNRDCKNYILTAYHCTIDSDDSDLLGLSARFNFQRANCGSGLAPSTQQRVGAFQRANSNDNGGVTGSDFALLELEDAIPANYVPFYAGWDVGGAVPASGGGFRVKSIHHPSGDVKKISTANSVVSSTWVQASNAHWRVEWMQTQTNWGVTEGGSSGSPIFDINKRIIGTLTGGGSFCDTPTADDFYGKMDRHWTGNPNPANQKLKVWLDPGNTGAQTLNGSFVDPNVPGQPCGGTAANLEEFEYEDFRIFPSLATDRLSISTSIWDSVKEVRIFGADGSLVDTIRLSGTITPVDVQRLASGIYYVSFIHFSGSHVTQKFSVIR